MSVDIKTGTIMALKQVGPECQWISKLDNNGTKTGRSRMSVDIKTGTIMALKQVGPECQWISKLGQ